MEPTIEKAIDYATARASEHVLRADTVSVLSSFFEYMREHYVGDMELEHSVSYLWSVIDTHD